MSIKAFGKSALTYSIGTIAARISMFALIPIYTHYLTMEAFGLLSILLLAIQVLGTIIDFGLLKSMMRFVPDYNKTKKEGDLLGSAIILNIISGIIVICIIFLTAPLFLDIIFLKENSTLIIFLTCFTSFTQSLSLNLISYFRAQNNAKSFTLLSILTAVLSLFWGYILIVLKNLDVEGALISYIISYTTIIIITLIKLFAEYKFSVSKNTLYQLIKYGFPLIFARSGDLIVGLVALTLLSTFVSFKHVALYNLASKISTIMSLILVLPFQLALEPYVFNRINDKDLKKNLSKIVTYLVLVFFILYFFIIFISPILLSLIAPPEYSMAYYIIIFILPIYLYQSFGYLGQSLLHMNKKSNITGVIIIIMTLLSLLLNYFLIKLLGLVGLIITINLNYLITAGALFYYGRREYYIKLETKRLSIFIISFLVLIIFTITMKDNSLLLHYILAPIGLYTVFLFYFKKNLFEVKEKNVLKEIISKSLNMIRNVYT